jgi:hypothetical protein
VGDPLAPRQRGVVRHVAPEAPRVVRAPLIEVKDRVVGDPEVQPPILVAHGSLRFDDIDREMAHGSHSGWSQADEWLDARQREGNFNERPSSRGSRRTTPRRFLTSAMYSANTYRSVRDACGRDRPDYPLQPAHIHELVVRTRSIWPAIRMHAVRESSRPVRGTHQPTPGKPSRSLGAFALSPACKPAACQPWQIGPR